MDVRTRVSDAIATVRFRVLKDGVDFGGFGLGHPGGSC